jgi:hypothetical protein
MTIFAAPQIPALFPSSARAKAVSCQPSNTYSSNDGFKRSKIISPHFDTPPPITITSGLRIVAHIASPFPR